MHMLLHVSASKPHPMSSHPPSQIELAQQRYALDLRLTPEERMEIANFYARSFRTGQVYGWGAFGLTFGLPLFAQYRRTGSTRGARVVLGLVGGMITMAAGTTYGVMTAYVSGLSRWENEGKENLVQLVGLLPVNESPMWMEYFATTAKQPEKRLGDPEIPGSGVLAAIQGAIGGAWDKVRVESGYTPPAPKPLLVYRGERGNEGGSGNKEQRGNEGDSGDAVPADSATMTQEQFDAMVEREREGQE